MSHVAQRILGSTTIQAVLMSQSRKGAHSMEIQNFKDPEPDVSTPWHQLPDLRILVHHLKRREFDSRHRLQDGSIPRCCQCQRVIRAGQTMVTVQRSRISANVSELHFHDHCFRSRSSHLAPAPGPGSRAPGRIL